MGTEIEPLDVCIEDEKDFDVVYDVTPENGLRRNLRITIIPGSKFPDKIVGRIEVGFTRMSFYDPFELSRSSLPKGINMILPNSDEIDIEAVYYHTKFTQDIEDIMLHFEISLPLESKEKIEFDLPFRIRYPMPMNTPGTYDIPILKLNSLLQRREFETSSGLDTSRKLEFCLLSGTDISTTVSFVGRDNVLLVETVTVAVVFLGYFVLFFFGLLPIYRNKTMRAKQKFA